MNTQNNITQEQLEAFDRYLNHTMDGNERLAFDIKLNDDATFHTKFVEYKAMVLAIESAGLKEEMDDFHDEMDGVIRLRTDGSQKKNSRFTILSIAASVVILMGAFYLINKDSATDALFAKHFVPDPGLPTLMGTTDQFEFYDAMVNYKQEDYDQAILKWEKLLPQKPVNDTLNFYLGVSYLATGNTEKAAKFLNITLQKDKSIFKEDAYYYAALAELKNDNPEAAKVLLQKVTSEKATVLLNELNN